MAMEVNVEADVMTGHQIAVLGINLHTGSTLTTKRSNIECKSM